MAILRIPDPGSGSDFTIYVNGETISFYTYISAPTWSDVVSNSSINGTIVNGEVVWNTGSRLFYNGEVVKGTDTVVDGRQYTVPTNYSLDLANFTGWANIALGAHTLSIKAKASGYQDSIASAEVTFTKMKEIPTDSIVFIGETSDFELYASKKTWDGTLQYSTDRSNWRTFGTSSVSSVNKKLYLRGIGNTNFGNSSTGGVKFVLSAKAKCKGNINTLLQYDNPPTTLPTNYCYYGMFEDCTKLTEAPDLPATTLTEFCYKYMFSDCENLTTAPELPATTLAKSCYEYMFDGCTALTTAPALPVTTLAESCYYGIFRSCENLTTAPELPATTLTKSCYAYMFWGCKNLTTPPSLPVTTLAESCYSGMFSGCDSLTTPPSLPATTLAESCYFNMFNTCHNLKISTTQTDEYKTAWRIPATGTISTAPEDWNYHMFDYTGGTFTGQPSINTTYYGAWE